MSEIMNNRVQNIKKIKGNTDFVNVVFPKVSVALQYTGIWYHIGKLVKSGLC